MFTHYFFGLAFSLIFLFSLVHHRRKPHSLGINGVYYTLACLNVTLLVLYMFGYQRDWLNFLSRFGQAIIMGRTT